jgi:hypothetical protein
VCGWPLSPALTRPSPLAALSRVTAVLLPSASSVSPAGLIPACTERARAAHFWIPGLPRGARVNRRQLRGSSPVRTPGRPQRCTKHGFPTSAAGAVTAPGLGSPPPPSAPGLASSVAGPPLLLYLAVARRLARHCSGTVALVLPAACGSHSPLIGAHEVLNGYSRRAQRSLKWYSPVYSRGHSSRTQRVLNGYSAPHGALRRKAPCGIAQPAL